MRLTTTYSQYKNRKSKRIVLHDLSILISSFGLTEYVRNPVYFDGTL